MLVSLPHPLHRPPHADPDAFQFGEFLLDVGGFVLIHGERRLPVEPKVIDLLALLVSRPGRLLGRHDLMDTLWPEVAVCENSLCQVVCKARRALGDDPRSPRYIETVNTRGYRFIAPVAALAA